MPGKQGEATTPIRHLRSGMQLIIVFHFTRSWVVGFTLKRARSATRIKRLGE
jgi:hypothetical protein